MSSVDKLIEYLGKSWAVQILSIVVMHAHCPMFVVMVTSLGECVLTGLCACRGSQSRRSHDQTLEVE